MKTRFTILCLFISVLSISATNISGTISSNMTLDTAGSPWIVTGSITVNAGVTLTVDPNVEVRFNSSRYLSVYGTLNADNALFTANSGTPTPGYWNRIYVYGSVNLDNCVIEYAQYGINLYGGDADLQNSTITECIYPIYYNEPSDLTQSNLVLSNNTNQIISHYYSQVDNGETYTLPVMPVPYLFGLDLTIANGGSLTIDAPNIIKMNSTAGIYVEGIFRALGTSSDEIIFTSYKDDNAGGDTNNDGAASSPISGDWDGIFFQDASVDAQCLLRYCSIQYGGHNNQGGIVCNNASPKINNCNLSNNYYGIRLNDTSNAVIDSTTIGTSTQTPIAMDFDANPQFLNNSFSFSDNNYDAIGIFGGTMTSSSTLPKRDLTSTPNVTYVLLGSVTVDSGVVLTIDPGVVIKPISSSYRLHIKGTLIAQGTSTEKIVFTSIHDDNHGNPNDTNKNGNGSAPAKNNWYGIVFEDSGASGSIMDHCIVNYGGTYSIYQTTTTHPYNHFTLRSGIATIRCNPTISNCTIQVSDHGISCYKDAAPTLTDNDIINSTSTPLAVTADSDPIYSGNTFTNAGLEAMGLIGTEIFNNGTIGKVNLGGYANITYVILGSHLQIANGAYIDVEPGIVIKSVNKAIITNGGFKAVGTPGEPIIFTSTKNDNVGNPMDTNGDGNATTPNYNDWYGIYYMDESDDNFDTLQYVDLSYARDRYSQSITDAGVFIRNASPTIDNVYIRECENGIGLWGQSNPVISNNTIENCHEYPIGISVRSNPVFTGNSIAGNGYSAFLLVDQTITGQDTVSKYDFAGFTNIPYSLPSTTISTGATLTVESGIIFKLLSTVITVRGGLRARGTPSEPIIFTSIHDDSAGGDSNNNGNATIPNIGNWGAILFHGSSMDTVNAIRNCDLRYGAGYNVTHSSSPWRYTGGFIRIRDAYIDISDNQFNFGSYGVGVYGTGNPDIDDNEFTNITNCPIHMNMFANPTFSGNTTANIGRGGIDIYYRDVWSQSATVPIRSFAGWDTTTYFINHVEINNGTTIIIPAGLTFKILGQGPMIDVKGKLDVQGSPSDPVVFTVIADDDYGSPKDSQFNGSGTTPNHEDLLRFQPESDDSSRIDHAIIRYFYNAIECQSASPIVSNSRIENGNWGIRLSGASSPIVLTNEFHDLAYMPIIGSLLNTPDTTAGNSLSGTTWRGIGVISETLTQDYTLKKKTFAGISGIPYIFESTYTIGTGAVLTVDTGVICKFGSLGSSYEYFNVERGLICNGGPNPGEQVVFTSITDDFYGGDTNADGKSETGYREWGGIGFSSISLDQYCQLNHVVIRGAYRGVICASSAPTFQNCRFQKNYVGAYVYGSANPSLDSCVIANNQNWGLEYTGNSFTIDAENCYWGDCSGPTHSSNPGGTGDQVSDNVDFDPWLCDEILPIAGDVSLNGIVQAYDASLILQDLASLITLTPQQEVIGDVSGEAGMTAYDASLILQYLVDIIQAFPVEAENRTTSPSSNATLSIDEVLAEPGETIEVPLWIDQVSHLYSGEIELHYDPTVLQLLSLEMDDRLTNMQHQFDTVTEGVVRMASAGTQAIAESGVWAILQFKVAENADMQVTPLTIQHFRVNESDRSAHTTDGQVIIRGYSSVRDEDNTNSRITVYPNPVDRALYLEFESQPISEIRCAIYHMDGRLLSHVNVDQISGQTMKIDRFESLPSGMYVLSIRTAEWQKSVLVQRR